MRVELSVGIDGVYMFMVYGYMGSWDKLYTRTGKMRKQKSRTS